MPSIYIMEAWEGRCRNAGEATGQAIVGLRAGTVVRVALGMLAYLAEPAVERLSGGAGRVGAALIVFLGGGLFYEDNSSCAIAAFYLHNGDSEGAVSECGRGYGLGGAGS